MRWTGDELLLVNDVGEFTFLPADKFDAFMGHRLPRESPDYRALASRHFLYDSQEDTAIELLATKYRTKKAFLKDFVGLHIFVVTLRCDHSCRYCQVSRVSASRTRFDMSAETARKSIDLLFRSPSPRLKVEFQGGEPLLNFDIVRYVVEEVEQRNEVEGRDIQFVVTTNLVPFDDEVASFCREHEVLLSTSLDGPAFIHDKNRPRPGKNSHAILVENLQKAREALGNDRISAIMTTSRLSLTHPREIVDEYVRLGFDAIFLRPISPYGFAVRTGESLRCESAQFLEFYKTALAHVIDLNRSGYDFVEVYAQILLTRILTPFATGYVDLQSPAGAGLGVVVYNYDGDIYASDESRMLAEMGDKSFRLGNVHSDGFEQVFGGEALRGLVQSSILEALPGCSECAFLPYCGADPIFHWRTQGDVVGHRPTSFFCQKNMGIFRHLFELLRGDDMFVRDLLMSWATRIRLDPLPGGAAASSETEVC
jgi:His-Xaa-Ser system radical SAM maturase HxsB